MKRDIKWLFITGALYLGMTVCILGIGYSVYQLCSEITTGQEKREKEYEVERREGRRFGDYQVVTIDGCEYLKWGSSMLTHKGNCSRCKDRE